MEQRDRLAQLARLEPRGVMELQVRQELLEVQVVMEVRGRQVARDVKELPGQVVQQAKALVERQVAREKLERRAQLELVVWMVRLEQQELA